MPELSELGYIFELASGIVISPPLSDIGVGKEINIQAGGSTVDNGGNLTLGGGGSTADEFFGGGVSIVGGVGGLDGNGGDILLSSGTGTGTGRNGHITLLANSAGNGHIKLLSLPTADPGVVGALYTVAGVLHVSAG